ncbi:hypothetical protein BGZ98_006499 [Dissophora globulifera]|nr:hypothetical protein BGZ98_006499 [Dissophora globulifera]
MHVPTPSSLYRKIDATRMAHNIIQGIPAGLVISLNAWATILINSQPRWLFRKKRWSEGEMRAISCYYLVVAYLMLRVVRLTSTLTKRPGRPYGDFFRNVRPILGNITIFSLATMMLDEFIMFYILRKFGLEKRRILITGRPLEKDTQMSDDDCCICYGAMLDDDEDVADQEEYYIGREDDHHNHTVTGLSKDTDHVLENFCVVKQHVAHRGCIRKWYNYGPRGYRPMEAFRVFNWGTTLHGAVAGMNINGHRMGLGWLLSLPLTRTGEDEQMRIPLETTTTTTTMTTTITPAVSVHGPVEHDHLANTVSPAIQPEEQQQREREQQGPEVAVDAAEPVLQPLFPQQQDDLNAGPRNAGRKTCPACRQQLVLNFVDLAKGRKDMGYYQKLREFGRDMTMFSDWRGLILRSLITAGWVGVTIVGGKLRILAMDKTIAKHQKNRVLATASALGVANL